MAIILDIETKAIVPGAPLLPEPVGVALMKDTGERVYAAFGHPDGNTHEWQDVYRDLRSIWMHEDYIITHNGAAFDIPVLQAWFDLPPIDPLRVHDTLFLSYLFNPHAKSLSLKELARDWLGIEPGEQKDLQDWILANTACKSRSKAGAYISEAPADLVAKYAIGDVTRTYALYQYLAPRVLPDMQGPYDRERKLAPILVGMQNTGLRVDHELLAYDTDLAVATLSDLDEEVRTRLNAPGLNIDSDNDLVTALRDQGFTDFLLTEKDKKHSASKNSLDKALGADPELRNCLRRRATYATLVGTFMHPWLATVKANDGRLHAAYNQTRNPDGYGTRTGRLSSSNPNLQNVPGDKCEYDDFGEMVYKYPLLRSYLIPEPGHVWVTADFKNQEPRIAAHFEEGAFWKAFNDDPNLDPYLFVAQVAGGIPRNQAKVVLLGLLYAMGAARLAESLGIETEEASRIRNVVKAALPDVAQLDYDCKRRFQMGAPIRTLGGRVYHCEPPTNGRSFEYKALNTLIQGSAADQAKEAMIYVHSKLLPGERIISMVHDEISVSCPLERVEAIKQIMQEAANALPCDVPMVMKIGVGNNWAEAK